MDIETIRRQFFGTDFISSLLLNPLTDLFYDQYR
jgi:hypothetical protein